MSPLNSANHRAFLKKLYVFFVAIGVLISSTAATRAQTNRIIKLDTTVELSATGDANVSQTLSMPPQPYASLRDQVGNPTRLVRMMQKATAWSELANLDGAFEDLKNSVAATYQHTGYSRAHRNGGWSIKFAQNEDANLIAIHANVAIFNTALTSDYGPMSIILRLVTPPGSTNLSFDKSENEFTYDFCPVIEEGENVEVEFDLDAQPQLMGSLAKVYGDERFDALWAARGVLRNTGDKIIRDYRVRFRVSGFSAWSGWNKSKIVYPGQTVIDPFFPVLDVEKLANMTGSRPAMVETEYQYQVNGETITENDSTTIHLTSRNQVVYSSRRMDQNLDWYESNDLAPFILTAISSSNDPVMQQLAGAVSGLSGGVPASSGNEEAYQFLSALWDYLEMNRVAYHTPPGWEINGYFGQHVKYGRDVLRNRAGTCIDLSILWASVAKSVGLRAHIALVWGHAFPVIQLPGGQMMGIESTMIGRYSFDQAIEQATGNLHNPERGLIIRVDIDAVEATGVHSIDLPRVDDDYLAKLGYKVTHQAGYQPSASQPAASQAGQNTQQTHGQLDQRLVGEWFYQGRDGDLVVSMWFRFSADGRYAFSREETENGALSHQSGEEGTWAVQSNTLNLWPEETPQEEYEYRVENGRFHLGSGDTEAVFEPSQPPAQRQPNAPTGHLDSRLFGTWQCRVEGTGQVWDLAVHFEEDGSYSSASQMIQNGQIIDIDSVEGSWSTQGNTLHLNSPNGQVVNHFRFQNGYLILNSDGNEYAFQKV